MMVLIAVADEKLVQQVFLGPDVRGGAEARTRSHREVQRPDPAAMECLERDLEECIIYLRFPEAHHRRIRTTNRIECLNGESSKHWRGIPMTATTLRRLQSLRAAIAIPRKEEEIA
jgi:transposase-like protein